MSEKEKPGKRCRQGKHVVREMENRERDVGRGGMLSEKGKPGKRCRQGRHVVGEGEMRKYI